MYDHLRKRGREFGVVFADRTILSNSHLALEASEYARDMGQYDKFHEEVFHANFSEVLDIGNLGLLVTVAHRCNLDVDDLMDSLKKHCYKSRIDEARKEGIKIRLTGVPTFIVNEKYKIVGAQPLNVFFELLNKLS